MTAGWQHCYIGGHVDLGGFVSDPTNVQSKKLIVTKENQGVCERLRHSNILYHFLCCIVQNVLCANDEIEIV